MVGTDYPRSLVVPHCLPHDSTLVRLVYMTGAHKVASLVMVLVAALCVEFVRAQGQASSEAAFEVASIKANRSGEPYVGAPGDRFSDGRFRYTNVPLRLLIRQAFERPGNDAVRGGPGWLDTDRWDFDARAESATADMLPMIRKLLTERFRLRHHIESEEGPVYELTFARRDRRLGSSLRQARGSRSFRGGSGSITGRALSILDLARLLSTGAGRPVLDRTGLAATYDVDLRWAPASPAGQAPSDLPDFFTAIQEQLWLRLQPARGPVDRMVIDSAERPGDN